MQFIFLIISFASGQRTLVHPFPPSPPFALGEPSTRTNPLTLCCVDGHLDDASAWANDVDAK